MKAMNIVAAANKWAKDEITSSYFFMLFGILYLLLSVALWQIGDSTFQQALVLPFLVVGGLLLAAGISFDVSNTSKLKNFASDYANDPSGVITSELERTEKTMGTYRNVALKVFPGFILLAMLLFFLVASPLVKGICVAVVAFFAPLVLLDSQALKRMQVYHAALLAEKASQSS